MTTPQSSYSIGEVKVGKRIFFVMEDKKDGAISLTHDIQDAVDYEIRMRDTVPAGVVYRDQAGVWDGWDPRARSFVLLRWPSPLSAQDAILQYIKMTTPHGTNTRRKHKS